MHIYTGSGPAIYRTVLHFCEIGKRCYRSGENPFPVQLSIHQLVRLLNRTILLNLSLIMPVVSYSISHVRTRPAVCYCTEWIRTSLTMSLDILLVIIVIVEYLLFSEGDRPMEQSSGTKGGPESRTTVPLKSCSHDLPCILYESNQELNKLF